MYASGEYLSNMTQDTISEAKQKPPTRFPTKGWVRELIRTHLVVFRGEKRAKPTESGQKYANALGAKWVDEAYI